jgi:hypothetical protein
MSDMTRKRLATVILTLSLLGGTGLAATTTTFESAWTEGNNQPPSGVFLAGKERFVAGANETHTGNLAALPRR